MSAVLLDLGAIVEEVEVGGEEMLLAIRGGIKGKFPIYGTY